MVMVDIFDFHECFFTLNFSNSRIHSEHFAWSVDCQTNETGKDTLIPLKSEIPHTGFTRQSDRMLSERKILTPLYVLYCIVLYCIVLHFISFHCIALHCILLYCIVSYC